MSREPIASSYMRTCTHTCVHMHPPTHTHPPTHAPTHTGIFLTIHNLIYMQLKQILNRDLRQRKIAEQSRKHGMSNVQTVLGVTSAQKEIHSITNHHCSQHVSVCKYILSISLSLYTCT